MLSAAINACKKQKNAKKRAACETAVRKRFAANAARRNAARRRAHKASQKHR
jgi:hypothetical protein